MGVLIEVRGFAHIRPIFTEEANYLKKKVNIDIPLEKCFMESNIVKAFTSYDETVNLFKISTEKVTQQVKLIKSYEESGNLLDWNQLLELYNNRLESLERVSLEKINYYLSQYFSFSPAIMTSGGKDSTVITHLVRNIHPSMPAYYNCTSNEVGEHIKYVKSIPNLTFINPSISFFKYCETNNFVPSRFARACCRIYKEELTLKKLDTTKNLLFFMGMRNNESRKRANYEDEHHISSYPSNWISILPIREWNNLDIWLYIFKNKIQVSPIYEKGFNRCGCIVCPYRTSYEDILTKEFYPYYIDKFRNIMTKNFISNRRWIYLNCTLQEFIDFGWKSGKVRDKANQDVIIEFSNYTGISIDESMKFFDQTCDCQRNNLKPKHLNDTEIALNLKLIGRNTDKLFCIKCLSSTTGVNTDTLQKLAAEFKENGCKLF